MRRHAPAQSFSTQLFRISSTTPGCGWSQTYVIVVVLLLIMLLIMLLMLLVMLLVLMLWIKRCCLLSSKMLLWHQFRYTDTHVRYHGVDFIMSAKDGRTSKRQRYGRERRDIHALTLMHWLDEKQLYYRNGNLGLEFSWSQQPFPPPLFPTETPYILFRSRHPPKFGAHVLVFRHDDNIVFKTDLKFVSINVFDQFLIFSFPCIIPAAISWFLIPL